MLGNAIHHQAQMAAQQSALRLMAVAGAVWPRGPLLEFVVEQILNDAVAFAGNARRDLDTLNATNVVQQSEWSPSDGEHIQIETDLCRCLDAIIHAHDLKVRVSTTNRTKFADGPNAQAHALLANTDRYSNLHIDLFGVASSYLTMPRATITQ